MSRKWSYFLDESFSHRLVDPLSNSGPIPLARYRMRWQREEDRCIITIALMWWLSVRENPTEVIVFLYTSVYCIFIYISELCCILAYTQIWQHVFKQFVSLYCTCFKLLYIEMSSVIFSWVFKVEYPELSIQSRISYLWVKYHILELSI